MSTLTEKICSTCHGSSEVVKFDRNRVTADGLQNVCRTCKAGYHRRWRDAHQRGVSVSDYERRLSQQGGVCAICQRSDTYTGRLCVDHDHKTGIARGLLCHKCNSLLGMGNDDVRILRRALAYLECGWTEE